MPIRYYEGVEGSGKSCMMSRDLFLHYVAGGRVLAFPGYELYDGKGNTISELVLPQQWVTLPEELKHKKIVFAIDEVTNFFNNHTWYNKICDLMAGLLAQRRKFEMAVLMTGPIFQRLPPNISELVHEVVHCQDNHTVNHAIRRGEKCLYYKEDMRGLLSRPSMRITRRFVFKMRPWYKYYNTYSPVSLFNQFTKLDIKNKVIKIVDGQIVEDDKITDESQPSVRLTALDIRKNRLRPHVYEYLKVLLQKGVEKYPKTAIYEYFRAYNQAERAAIGSIIQGCGGKTLSDGNVWDLRRLNLEIEAGIRDVG